LRNPSGYIPLWEVRQDRSPLKPIHGLPVLSAELFISFLRHQEFYAEARWNAYGPVDKPQQTHLLGQWQLSQIMSLLFHCIANYGYNIATFGYSAPYVMTELCTIKMLLLWI